MGSLFSSITFDHGTNLVLIVVLVLPKFSIFSVSFLHCKMNFLFHCLFTHILHIHHKIKLYLLGFGRAAGGGSCFKSIPHIVIPQNIGKVSLQAGRKLLCRHCRL